MASASAGGSSSSSKGLLVRGSSSSCGLKTNKYLKEAALYRSGGYTEVAPFNSEPYAHHWCEKVL